MHTQTDEGHFYSPPPHTSGDNKRKNKQNTGSQSHDTACHLGNMVFTKKTLQFIDLHVSTISYSVELLAFY